MSDSPVAEFSDSARWLAEATAAALKSSLEAMTGAAVEIQWSLASSDAPAAEEVVRWEQTISSGPGARLWFTAAAADALETGKAALTAAGLDEMSGEECLATWKEILGQTFSVIAQQIGRRLGREITAADSTQSDGSTPASPPFLLLVRRGEQPEVAVGLGWTVELERMLTPPPPPPRPTPPVAEARPSAPASAAPEANLNSRTLALLLEVEMPVSVSFGRAQLPLKDVLKLNSGSIVELNRAVTDLVEVIINNCVIARGEVVVVEGNYGIRIKQIVSREERLRTLY